MNAPLTISPKSVILRAHQSQAFELTNIDPAQPIEWTCEPKAGRLNDKGIYTAPEFFWVGKRVTVTATNAGRTASSEVELSAAVFWTLTLGIYWIVLTALLLWLIIGRWTYLCPVCVTPEVVISPSITTLPASGQQQFTANTPVTWSNVSSPAGLYSAPEQIPVERAVTITATSKIDPNKSGAALVVLSPDLGISVYPQNAVVEAGKSVDFVAVISRAPTPQTELEWLRPPLGEVSAQGRYTAPPPQQIRSPQIAQIVVRTKTQPQRTAATSVTVLPQGYRECAESQWGPLLLIALMGAVGGLIHGASSFAQYVGNRQLRVSWVWWYFLKPVQGALVGLVFYLVYRSFGGNDIGLESGNCVTLGALAGLIGLFSEPATLKLKEIFDTVFTVRRDPRGDQAKAGGDVPRILGMEPESLRVGVEKPELTVRGQNFLSGCSVLVNDSARLITSFSTTELRTALKPEDVAQAGTLAVKVVNPGGQASDARLVSVA